MPKPEPHEVTGLSLDPEDWKSHCPLCGGEPQNRTERGRLNNLIDYVVCSECRLDQQHWESIADLIEERDGLLEAVEWARNELDAIRRAIGVYGDDDSESLLSAVQRLVTDNVNACEALIKESL